MLDSHNRRLAKALVTFDLGTNNEEKIHYLSSLIVPLEVRCLLHVNFSFTLFMNLTQTHAGSFEKRSSKSRVLQKFPKSRSHFNSCEIY
jgi:hypothetical protein